MHELYELKEKLIKELEEYSANGKFSKEDVETIKYLTSAVDHLCNIMEDTDGEYSGRSYAGGGNRSYNMGGGTSYARGRGRNARRDSMGRYSRTGDSVEQLMQTLGESMRDLPEDIRKDAERFMRKLDEMA